MVKFIKINKKIPLHVDNTIRSIQPSQCPEQLIPLETNSPSCKIELDGPYKITDKAVCLFMDCIVRNIETYFKSCSKCGMIYRYQEYKHGVHNFDDIFIVSLDVLFWLRGALEQHIPITNFVLLLEKQIGEKIVHQRLLNAYLHFDALSDHKYLFSCAICGHHPKTLVMNLNKKVTFKCALSDLTLPDDYDENEADYVDCKKFWERVENSIVAKGLTEKTLEEFRISPNLLFWSPYIGPQTRSSQFILNTEHRKISKDNGKLEADCREITEERLLEMLQNMNYSAIKQIAKGIGIKGDKVNKGSKMDIIMHIKNCISKDDEKFNKTFSKLWGSSGGWVSLVCPHSVVYGLKFVLRAESPRDYVDLLLSMKYLPNVVISDMANLIARQGNDRSPGMFSPNDGMITEPTKDNITRAENDDLVVHFPWLRDECPIEENNNSVGHPVSGSSVHLCLFDRFHERNVKGKREILR